MTRQVFLGCAAGVACMLSAGCADYPESREQRPVYSFENVEMGPSDSGRDYRSDGAEEKDRDPRR